MLKATCLVLALASAFGFSSEDGPAWISKAESRLYRWQKPGAVVRFDVKTDALDAAIASMQHDLAQKPDREGTKMVEALKQVAVHGAVDTATGTVETQIDLTCDSNDPRVKASVEQMKNLLGSLVQGAIAGLPLHDPTLVPKGSTVLGAELQGDFVIVTIAGSRPGEQVNMVLNRRSSLPTTIDMPGAHLSYVYAEVVPGRFAPAKLEVEPKSGQASSAEYSWQKVENVVFPAHIHLSQGTRTSNLAFESVRIEPRPR
jgi:hypothetical protein